MEVKFIYSKTQLDDVAKFISTHNRYLAGRHNYASIKNSILESMRTLAKSFPECYWISTGGYTVMADIHSEESMDTDENLVAFDILVDPSISKDTFTDVDTQSETLVFSKKDEEMVLL